MDVQDYYGSISIWEALVKLLLPMTGQQKNLLLSLATVVQTPIKVMDPIRIFTMDQVEKGESGGAVSDVSSFHAIKDKLKKTDFDRVSPIEQIESKEFYEQVRIESILKNSLKRAAMRWKMPARDVVDPSFSGFRVVPRERTCEKIVLAGSKMHSESGVWHSVFASFLSRHGFRGDIFCLDFFEDEKVEDVGNFRLYRSKPRDVSGCTILVDDCQAGDDLVDFVSPPYRHSLKKRGSFHFNYEPRFFSLVPSILPYNLFSECQCQRCQASAFISYRLDGYGTFQALQLELSRFGPVCVRERLEERLSAIYLSKLQNSAINLEKISRYKRELGIIDGKRTFIETLLLGRRLRIQAYYDQFPCSTTVSDYNTLVSDSVASICESGYPDLVVSREMLDLPGYSRQERGVWQIFTRIRGVAPRPSSKFKV